MVSTRKVGNYQKHDASSTRKACGFTTLNDVNGKEYVPEFYINDIENVSNPIKF